MGEEEEKRVGKKIGRETRDKRERNLSWGEGSLAQTSEGGLGYDNLHSRVEL